MKIKRGLFIFLALAIFLAIPSVLAEPFSIQAFVESPWVNAAVLFLLVFNVILFVVKDIFRGSYGSAIIISLILALASSLATVYYLGPFLAKVGIWLLVLCVIVIVVLLFRLSSRSQAGGMMFWILGIASVAWLAFLRGKICPPAGFLPQNICQIIDVVAIILLIICFIKLIIWLFTLFGVRGGGGGGGGGGELGGGGDKPRKASMLARMWARRNESAIEKNKRKQAEAIDKKYKRLMQGASRQMSLQKSDAGKAHYEKVIKELDARRVREIQRIYGEAQQQTSIVEQKRQKKEEMIKGIAEKYENQAKQLIEGYNQHISQFERAADIYQQQGNFSKMKYNRTKARNMLKEREQKVRELMNNRDHDLEMVQKLSLDNF